MLLQLNYNGISFAGPALLQTCHLLQFAELVSAILGLCRQAEEIRVKRSEVQQISQLLYTSYVLEYWSLL